MNSINCTNDWEIFAMHPAGAMGVYADGSVHFLARGTDMIVLAALCSRAGGEIAQLDD